MCRRTIAVFALLAASASASAHADAWMVKSSILGCRDRAALVALDTEGTSRVHDGTPPLGCVALDAGERLLDQPEIGAGFDDYVKLQRRDGSMVFVRRSAVVRDPGIGSISEDRAGEE